MILYFYYRDFFSLHFSAFLPWLSSTCSEGTFIGLQLTMLCTSLCGEREEHERKLPKTEATRNAVLRTFLYTRTYFPLPTEIFLSIVKLISVYREKFNTLIIIPYHTGKQALTTPTTFHQAMVISFWKLAYLSLLDSYRIYKQVLLTPFTVTHWKSMNISKKWKEEETRKIISKMEAI